MDKRPISFDNFALKAWLRKIGPTRRCEILRKLRNELERLGLAKIEVRKGLLQLATRPHVTLSRHSNSGGPCWERSAPSDLACLEEASDARSHRRPETAGNETLVPEAVAVRPDAGAEPFCQDVEQQGHQDSLRRSNEKLHAFDEQLTRLDRICLTRISNKGSQARISNRESQERINKKRIPSNRRRASDGDQRLRDEVRKNGICSVNSRGEETRIERMDGANSVPELSDTIELVGPRKWIPEKTKIKLNLSNRSRERLGQEAKTDNQKMPDPSLAPGLAEGAAEEEGACPETAVEKVQAQAKKVPCNRILVDSRLNYVIEPRKREESDKKKRMRSSLSPVPLYKRRRMLSERGRKRRRDLERRIKQKFRVCFGECPTLSEDEQEQMIMCSRKRRKKDSVDSVDSTDSGVCLSRFSGGTEVQRAVPDSTIRETDEEVCQSPKEGPFGPDQGHGEEFHLDSEESSDRCSPDTATRVEIPLDAIKDRSRIYNVDNRIDKADSVMREFMKAIGTDKRVRKASESEVTGGTRVDDTDGRMTWAARVDDTKSRIGGATRIADTDNEVMRVDDTEKEITGTAATAEAIRANDTKDKVTGSTRITEIIRRNDVKWKTKETARLTHSENKIAKTGKQREATRMDDTKEKTVEANKRVREAVKGNDTKDMITKAAKKANTGSRITEATMVDGTNSRITEFTGTNGTYARIEGVIDIKIKEPSSINNIVNRIEFFKKHDTGTWIGESTGIHGTEDRRTEANWVNIPDNRITDSLDNGVAGSPDRKIIDSPSPGNRIIEGTGPDKLDNSLGESIGSDDRIGEVTRTSSSDEASKTRRVDNRDNESSETNEVTKKKRDSPAFNKAITLRHSEDRMEDKTEPSVSSKSKQLLDVGRFDKNISAPLHVISIEEESCPAVVNPALTEAINNTHMELSLQNDMTIKEASTHTANNVYTIKNGGCSAEKSSSLRVDNKTMAHCTSENHDRRREGINEMIGCGNYAILEDIPTGLSDVDDDSESEESRLVISMEDPDESVSLDENEVSTSETLNDNKKNDEECPSKLAVDTKESIHDDCIVLEGNSTDCPLSVEQTIDEDETDKENRVSIEVATEIVAKSSINNETINNSERGTEVTSTTATEDKKDKEEANSDKITIVLEKTSTNFEIKTKQDLMELLYSNLKDAGHIILNGHVVTISEEKGEVLSKNEGSSSSHSVTKENSQKAKIEPAADKSLEESKENDLLEDVPDLTEDKAEEMKATETGPSFKLRVLSSAELGSRWCLTPALEDTQDTSSIAVASGLGNSTVAATLTASVTSTTSPSISPASVSASSLLNNAASSAVSSTAAGVVSNTEIPVTVGSSVQREVSKESNRQHCLNSLVRIGQILRVIREAAQAFTTSRASSEVDQMLSLKEKEVKYKQATRELVKELQLLARLIYSNNFQNTIRIAITTLNSKFFASRPLSVDEVLSYTSNWTENFEYACNAQPRNETGQELPTSAHNKPSNGQPALWTYARQPSSDTEQTGRSNLDPRNCQFKAQTRFDQIQAGSGTGCIPQVSHPVPSYTERTINQQPGAQWSRDQAKASTQDRRVLSEQNCGNSNNKQGLQNPGSQNYNYGSFVEPPNQNQHSSGGTVSNGLRNGQNAPQIPFRLGPEVRQPNSTNVNNVGQPYSGYSQPNQQPTDKSAFDSSKQKLRKGRQKTDKNRQRPVTKQLRPSNSQNITYLMQPRNPPMGPRYQGPALHPIVKQTLQPTQQQVQHSMQQQTQQAQQKTQRCTQQAMQQSMPQFMWQPMQDLTRQQTQNPIQQLVQQPVQQLVQQPIRQPMQQLAQQPVQPLVRQPVQQSQLQPVQQLVRQPVQQPQQQPVQQFMQPQREPTLYLLPQLPSQPTTYPIVLQPAQQHFPLYTQQQQQSVQQQAQFVQQLQVTQPVHRPVQQLPQHPPKAVKEQTPIEVPNENTTKTNLAKDSNDKTLQDAQHGFSKCSSDKPEDKSSKSKSLTTLQKIILIQQIDFHCRDIGCLSSAVSWVDKDKIRSEIAWLERLKNFLLSNLRENIQEILERDSFSEEKQKGEEKSEPKCETADAPSPATNKQEPTNEQEDNKQEQMIHIKDRVRDEQERAINQHDRPPNEQERVTNEEDQATIEQEQAKDEQIDLETFVGLSMPLLEDSSRLNVVKDNESSWSREKEPEENGPGSNRVEAEHEEKNSERSEVFHQAENETVPEGESREEVEKKITEEAEEIMEMETGEEIKSEKASREIWDEKTSEKAGKKVVVKEGSEETQTGKIDKEILVVQIVEEIQKDREVKNNIEVQKAKEVTKGVEEVVAEQEEASDGKEAEGEKAVEKRAQVGEREVAKRRKQVGKVKKYVEAAEKFEQGGHKVSVVRAGDLEEEDEEIDVEFVEEEPSLAVCLLDKQPKADGEEEDAEEEDEKSSETEEEDQDTQTESEQDTLILSEDDSAIVPENLSTNSPISVSSAETTSPFGKTEEKEEVKESSEPEGSGSELKEPKTVDCDSSVPEKPSKISSSLKEEEEEEEGSPNLALNIESIQTITMEAFEKMDSTQEMECKICLNCCKPSMVVCEECLEAQYCSKRCSELHWVTHYKDCRRHAVYSTIEQPLDIV